jgi:hypothetical protein
MNSIRSIFVVGGLFALISLAFSAVFSLILAWFFMWLWNDAFVPITGLPPLSYWRAVELLLLFLVVKFAIGGVAISGESK